MALQVWLPLNGSTENQGLADVTVTLNPDVAFSDAGKIGKAYEGNGSRNCRITGLTLGTTASIAWWSKTSTGAKMPWVLESTASNYLNFFNSSIYTLNTGDSNSNPFRDDDSGNSITALNDGAWHHFVVTFDGDTAKLYIDGTYRGHARMYKEPTTTSTHRIKLAGDFNGSHSYDWNGLLNDFRVYDNCLTDDEIHELALGKMAHYHMDDNAWDGTNLWRNSSCRENLTDIAQSSNTFSITNKDGYQCAHLTGALNTTGYLTIPDAMLPENGSWYTISADMRLDNYVGGSTNPFVGLYFAGSYIDGTWYSVTGRTGDGDAVDRIYPNNYNNKGWHRVYITGQFYKDYPSAFKLAYVYARDFTGDLYVKNIKFEKGKRTSAPDWVPADGDTVFGSGLGPTGNNMLYDTNASSLTAENGPGARYYESTSASGYTNTFEELTDPPLKEIRYGVRQVVTAVNSFHSVVWYANGGVPVVVGQPYTMSCYVKVVSGTSQKLHFQYGGFSSYESYIVNLISDGMWHRYSWTFTPNSSCASGNQTRIYPGGLFSVGTALICGWKLEKGIKVTPWQPHPTEMTKSYYKTINDCSGFKHNLMILSGSTSLSTNTPKYMASTQFTNCCAIQKNEYGGTGDNVWSMCAWVKLNSYASELSFIEYYSGRYLTVYKDGRVAIYSYGKSPAGYHYSNGTVPLGTWTHIAVVWETSAVKIYINGALDKSISCTGNFTYPNAAGAAIELGNEHYGTRPLDGYESDVRSYATALSLTDIQKIYAEGTPPNLT